ncbi:MAG TPA: Eco57I restriction-modification methylase domain-containing protein [Caldisericia bacterium]|nr:Eco57I restriction-modification methylase domain-containing protein [Caldisericia bacterium]
MNFFKNEKEKEKNELKNLVDEYSNKVRMFGEDKKEKEEVEKTVDNLNREKEKIDSEIEEYKNIYDDLIRTKEKTYFLWDICFSNVFKEKGGFDLVIGNPPYVRQELIGPPLIKNASREQKDSYKKKLQERVEKTWGYKVGGRCDLYVYFYFQSLYLLNKNGTFCFINSNSWLDVDFGKYLQEFLLKNFEIKRIIDNQVKRSFKEADINTIMVLINYPEKESLNNKVKFIMFKKPFDEAIKINNELLIEEKDELFKNEDLRIFPKLQKELLLEGIEGDEKEEVKLLNGKYEGGKWGGIYLRAPDIYFTILEKGKGKFVKLDQISKIEGYIHGFNIGTKFPKVNFIEGPSKVGQIYLDENAPGVEFYGVKKTGNSRQLADLLYPRMFGHRFFILVNFGDIYGQKFYKIIIRNKKMKISLGAFLNSTISILQNEILLYSTWGLGAISVNSNHLKQLRVFSDFKIDEKLSLNFFKRPVRPIFEELGLDPDKPIRDQEPNPLPDRKELDDIVFDVIGLTQEERKEIYWAVAELVQNRLKKAKSV